MKRIRPSITVVNNENELRDLADGDWLPTPKEYPVLVVITKGNFEEYFYGNEVQELLTNFTEVK